MEVRVNVVSRRFRRASVAGLAAFVTAGVAVLATAGSAAAFTGAGGGGISSAGSVTVYPGLTGQALSNVTVSLPDASGAGWSAGDFLTFTLTSDPAGTTSVCQTTSNLNKSASLAAPTVTAANQATSAAFTGFTVTQGSSSTCNVKDQFTIALTSGATNDTSYTLFTISGLSLSLGSAIAPGTSVYLSVVASNGTPFGTTASNKASAQVASVGNVSVSTSVVGATPGATVAINPIVVTDVIGGTINAQIQFKLATSGVTDKFATAGTLTAPSGVTFTGPSETLPSNTLTYTITGSVPAGGKFTLTGATVTVDATQPATLADHVVQVLTVTTPPSTLGQVGPNANVVVVANTSRTYAGVDRYATSAALFAANHNSYAVVASGMSYADGLSADVLAAHLGTGVLLTDPNSLPDSTRQALINNGVAIVYIVGGTSAVSANVESQIAALHVSNNPANPLITVYRIAGSDRYQTNMQVNLTAGPTGRRAIIATGTNFADALAVSPEVYSQHYALVLTDPNSLSSTAQSTLTDLGITNVIIVGGTSAVSANVESQLKSDGFTVLYRIAGADRTGTAAQIAIWATAGLSAANGYNALASLGYSTGTAELTRGDAFPDALSAGPAVGSAGHVLLLTANPTTLGSGAGQYLGGKAGTVTTFDAIGFAAAVSPSVVTAAIAALG